MLILDVRGSGFLPSVAPRIVTEDGRCIFEGGDLDIPRVRKRRTAMYVGFRQRPVERASEKSASPRLRALARARKVAGRAGGVEQTLHQVARKRFKNPLIFKATRAAKDAPGTLVLSNAALRSLATHPEAKTLLQAGRVLIVVNQVKARK